MPEPAILMYADSLRDPDLYFATGISVVDPFIYLEVNGRKVIVTSELEADAARRNSTATEVRLFTEFGSRDLVRSGMTWDAAQLEVLRRAVAELGLAEVAVPPTFRLEAADFLRGHGVSVTPDRDRFELRRRSKDERALAAIRAAQRATEAAMARVVEVLGSSSPTGDGLSFEGEPLTAERVRAEVIETLRAHGCEGEPPITSPGPQGAFVHELGTGPVRPGESLIVDIFPTDATTRFCADMTRTFCFGEAPEQLRHMHATVLEAVKRSTDAIRAGVNGRAVWEAACDAIEGGGYRTQRGVASGETLDEDFFHGLGHGVGLEVHEPPSMGMAGDDLIAGDVVTIEPGVYRKDLGGVRLEDLAVVRDGGCEVLTDFPYDLEVKP
ncbi:MAG TPA: Xaa-Pro peptidase family protein [Gaiellales bacterium]|jgi:Xaa-Pro aminopeptidase|nr:Xaa-Pro peptidase family protein [Gaiellales bacterium]